MSEPLLRIAPTVRLVTEEEQAGLQARQEATAAEMGQKWILHPVHAPARKGAP